MVGLCLLQPVSKFFQARGVRIAADNLQLIVLATLQPPQSCPCYELAQAVSLLFAGRYGTFLLGCWRHGQSFQSPVGDCLLAATSSSPLVSLLLSQTSPAPESAELCQLQHCCIELRSRLAALSLTWARSFHGGLGEDAVYFTS